MKKICFAGLLVVLAGCGRPPVGAQEETPVAAQARGVSPDGRSFSKPLLPLGPPLAVSLTFSSEVASPYAVVSGIPFARGSLTSLEHLRLEDASGKAQSAQFTPLAQWPDGSYKAVLVSVTLNPRALTQSYTLRSGAGVSPASEPRRVRVEEAGDTITVTTGPIRFEVSKTRFRLFDQVWIDADQNGAFEPEESLLKQPADIFLVDGATDAEYRASRFTHSSVVVEEAGPVKAVLLAKGKLQSASGGTLTDVLIRMAAYAGEDQVYVDYTLVDAREEKNVSAKRDRPALEIKSYGIELPLSLASGASGLFGGDRMQGYVAFGGPMQKTQYLYQGGRFNFVNGQLRPYEFWYAGVGQGERADGWMDASDARRGVTAMIRKFWQQFPKELAIEDNRLILYLHPPRASSGKADLSPGGEADSGRYERPKTFYFPREGGAKTYQLLFSFHRGRGSAQEARALYETFNASPRLIAEPQWYCESGVFGNLIVSAAGSDQHDSALMRNIYERSVEAGERTGSLARLYGWRDFGDRLRPGWEAQWGDVKVPAFYNDTHVGAHNFFLEYLRTKDERWFELGEEATRHWMDIDVSHANRQGYWRRGYGPGEGHLINHSMIDHDCRNQHKGHAHLSGTQELYLLTGDKRALEVLRESSDWWVKAVPDLFPVPIEKPHYAEAERDFAWPLFVLNEAYRVTGDEKYHKAGAHIVRHLIQWWQTPSEHLVKGKSIERNDYRQGTGWWAMYPKCDNCPDGYNGANGWMAGALLSAIIQFKEQDRDWHLVSEETVDDMLLQTMNYVVKYGWRPGNYFLYSEAVDYGGVTNHLLYPLAYLARRYQQGGLKHPEWYDTAPRWAQIAREAFQAWQDKQSAESTDMGFYGYEIMYPMDFFALMQELEQAGAPPAAGP